MESKENLTFSRTELLLGKAGMDKLKASRVALFGVGGVGGYALEALVRSGVGHITLIDGDCVSESNINRQIIATQKTVGIPKVEAARERALQINPHADIRTMNMFYTRENADEIDLTEYDYVIDAIDTVSSKIELIVRANQGGVAIISSMGAGNKLDPCAFEVSDIYKTSVCPLARVMRTELKRRGIKHLKVVYSKEEPIRRVVDGEEKRHAPASIAFVPSVVGLIIAGEVIKQIALG
jgi:tRNA A37 threonylcarbamoyladenosine dehydratase